MPTSLVNKFIEIYQKCFDFNKFDKLFDVKRQRKNSKAVNFEVCNRCRIPGLS